MKISLLVTLFTLCMTTAFAGDAAKGKKLYKKIGCHTCHKKDGMGKAKMKKGKLKLSAMKGPRIAGLSEAYIKEQLAAVHSGARKTKYTASMKSKIKKYSDADFADVAAYVNQVLGKKSGAYKGMLEK